MLQETSPYLSFKFVFFSGLSIPQGPKLFYQKRYLLNSLNTRFAILGNLDLFRSYKRRAGLWSTLYRRMIYISLHQLISILSHKIVNEKLNSAQCRLTVLVLMKKPSAQIFLSDNCTASKRNFWSIATHPNFTASDDYFSNATYYRIKAEN